MLFREGEAGKHRECGEQERKERKIGLCQISFLFVGGGLEGLPQMMTDSSKVFRGPGIYEELFGIRWLH